MDLLWKNANVTEDTHNCQFIPKRNLTGAGVVSALDHVDQQDSLSHVLNISDVFICI